METKLNKIEDKNTLKLLKNKANYNPWQINQVKNTGESWKHRITNMNLQHKAHL